MIREQQHEIIERKAYAFDHHYLYYSLISGEPFLYDESLFYYYDGRKLSIHLIELDPGKSRAKFQAIVQELRSRFDPEAIIVWGPDPIVLPAAVPGWDVHILARSTPYGRDMTLMLETVDPTRIPGMEEARQYTRNNPVEVRAVKQKQITVEHIRLLHRMIRRNKPGLFDRIFYSAESAWTGFADTTIFEARMENRLMGYIILDESLRTLPMMLIGCYERKPPVFSDLLYDSIIRYCIDNGYDRLVFGHSYTKGLYDYKMKWGQFIVQPGVWEIMLSKSASEIKPHNYPWLARLLYAGMGE